MKHFYLFAILSTFAISICYGYDISTNTSCIPPTSVNPDNLSLRIVQGTTATRFDVALPNGFHGKNRCITIGLRESPYNVTVYGTEYNNLLIGNPQFSMHFQMIQDQLKYIVYYTVSGTLYYASTVIVNATGTSSIYYNGLLETATALVGEAPLIKI